MGMLRPAARLIVTRGHRGGTVVSREAGGTVRVRRYAAVRGDRVVDPTGAGDVLLAATLAVAVRPDLLREAGLAADPAAGAEMLLPAAAASLVVELPGSAGVPDLAAVIDRIRQPVADAPSG
jgi:sugar/nucleoside kinase (ribokinase family)